MTRKDYVAVAEGLAAALVTAKGALGPEAARGVVLAGRKVADVLQADNPRFDRDRFIAAAFPIPHTAAWDRAAADAVTRFA